MFFYPFYKKRMEDFCVQTKRFAKGDLLRSERSSFGAQYAVFCDLKCRVLEKLRHCADTLIIYYDCIYPPACRKGRGKSGCLQYVKHWIMRDLTGFIGILLPTCMLRVIYTKHTKPVSFITSGNAMSAAKEGTSCASFHLTVCELPTFAAVLG